MHEPNNLDWKGYEAITKYIYETLGKEFGIKIECYGKNCKVTGKSGVPHQIDVLTSSSDNTHTYRTAIECKYWKKKVNKDIVMKVSEIIKDAEIDKGIIVSKSGYTRDAVNFADHSNIGLVELHERENNGIGTEPEKIVFGILELHQHITILRPEILSISVDYGNKVFNENETINRYCYTILLSNGNKIPLNDLATSFQDNLRNGNKLFQTVTQRHEIVGGSLINNKNKSSVKIRGLIFTGVLTKIDKNYKKEYSLVDQVWLIMKSIFEERTFTISENGFIMENKK